MTKSPLDSENEVAERGYLYDAPDLGIQRVPLGESYWERARGRYLKAIELSGKRGGLWLDCACGSGFGTEIIADSADYVIGLDIDAPTIEYADRFHGRSSKVAFRVGDAMNLPAGWDNLFDVVISIETIEHLPGCTPYLQQAYMLLKPGGVAVVTTPASQIGGGPNPLNPFHINELTEERFWHLMGDIFDETERYWEEAIFTTGVLTKQLFGIGRKIRRRVTR